MKPVTLLPATVAVATMTASAFAQLDTRDEHIAELRTMVETLDFVTAAGGMHGVVTPLAVFVKRDDRLALQSWHPDASLAEVRERTGFEFDSTGAAPTPVPTGREISAIHSLDPDGQFDSNARVSIR